MCGDRGALTLGVVDPNPCTLRNSANRITPINLIYEKENEAEK